MTWRSPVWKQKAIQQITWSMIYHKPFLTEDHVKKVIWVYIAGFFSAFLCYTCKILSSIFNYRLFPSLIDCQYTFEMYFCTCIKPKFHIVLMLNNIFFAILEVLLEPFKETILPIHSTDILQSSESNHFHLIMNLH